MKTQIKAVAVTGLHRGENPQPGAAVIASLRRAFPNLRIIGLSYDPLESSLYGRGNYNPDAAYLIPYPGAGADALLERLDMISKKEELGFVIPCLDSEIENFTAIYPELQKRGIECILPTASSFEARDKSNLYDFCRRIGIPSPETKTAMDPLSVEKCAEEVGYPVYVKGRLYQAHLANSRDELAEAYDGIVRVWGWPVMIQKALAGEEYDVTGVGDGTGRIIKSCTVRKLLRTANGKGFAGIVVVDPELDRIAQRIISELRWDGPFELEFLKESGKPHALLEINPRFPAWIDFPSQIGCNLPALLFERLLKQDPTPLKTCVAGQMFIRHSIDLVGDFSEFVEMASSGERIFTHNTAQNTAQTEDI